MKVRLSAPARADLVEHIDWLTSRCIAAADQASERIFYVLDLLGDFPEAGIAREDGTREKGVSFGRDGYILRYEVDGAEVIVRRIFHTRQNR